MMATLPSSASDSCVAPCGSWGCRRMSRPRMMARSWVTRPDMPTEQDLDTVRGWIDAAQRVVVLTGAGISTDSGIPDFRGPQGLWTRNPAAEKQSTIQNYLADPQVRQAAWRARLEHFAWTAKPNRGHLALVELERRGKLHALITQNIDELHQIAGNSAQRVIEVHGTVRRFMCWQCGHRGPMDEALAARARRRGRPTLPALRRHPEERHHLLRPGPRAAGHRPRDERRGRGRPDARRGFDAAGLSGGGQRRSGQGGRRARGHPQRPADAAGRAGRPGVARPDRRVAAGASAAIEGLRRALPAAG